MSKIKTTDISPARSSRFHGKTSVKITRVQEKSYGPEKWKLTEIIICYSNEYATDITDILNKIIS